MGLQARSWLGTKYHHQGRLKKSPTTKGGVDCIGLVVGVVEELGIHNGQGKPLSAYDETGYSMYPDGRRLLAAIQEHMRTVAVDDLRPGDVALFKMFSDPQHVGLISTVRMMAARREETPSICWRGWTVRQPSG